MTAVVMHGDAIECMRSMPDRSVDLVITDPPYSPKVHNASRRGITNYRERKGDAARAARSRDLGFDYISPELMLGCAQQWKRLVRRWVKAFCDVELAPVWRFMLEGCGLEYVRTAFWHKTGATPQLTGDRPASHVEAIVIAHQTHDNGKPMRKVWNRGGCGNVYEAPWDAMYREPIALDRGHNGTRVHTTQKPRPLMDRLLADFARPGELVLDPFAGSGTTLVAAQYLGAHAIGVEEKAEYVEVARQRVAGVREQGRLEL